MYHIPEDKRAIKSVEKLTNGLLNMIKKKNLIDN